MVFGAFCYAKSYNFQRVKKSDPHCDPHWLAVSGFAGYCQLMPFGYGRKNAAHRQGSSASQPVRCAVCFWLSLPHLRHEVAYGLSRLVLLLPGGVSVGRPGEPSAVVANMAETV